MPTLFTFSCICTVTLQSQQLILHCHCTSHVLLSLQQAEVLRKHTSLRVSHFCGDMNVDYWDRKRWAKELQEQDIWVMTPQILLNVVRHGFLKVTCEDC